MEEQKKPQQTGPQTAPQSPQTPDLRYQRYLNADINMFSQKDMSGQYARLWKEWKDLDVLCAKRRAVNPRRPSLSYKVRKRNVYGLPMEYEILYRCKTIVGIKEEAPREPIFGTLHCMSIVLPNNYPSADGNPQFRFLTPVWHPNIRFNGSYPGHVCLTIKEMGVMASLKDLVLRVERYLKYQLYHAENTYPYPEDLNVAEWVREEGEPNGWIKFSQKVDDEPVSQFTPQTEKLTTSKPKVIVI